METVRTGTVLIVALAMSLSMVSGAVVADTTSSTPAATPSPVAETPSSLTDAASDDTTYAVVQGGTCVDVSPFGDGSQTVEDFYNYRTPSDGLYSSHGTTHLQESQTSQLFLYEGANGLSLVAVHDELGDESEGGRVSFNVTGLPSGAEWAVQDDSYAGQENDNFTSLAGGNTSTHADWFWQDNRTDGGAIRGLDSTEFDTVVIEPGFNDAAHHPHPDDSYQDDTVDAWNVLSDDGTADGSATSLSLSENVGVVNSTCEELAVDQLLERVDVWDRAILPLRADESNAATQIPNADWRVRSPNGDETNLNKDPIAVFDQSDTITVEFDAVQAGGSSAEFSGTDVRLVAARLEPTQNRSTILGTDGSSLSLFDMFVSDINENVTFTYVGDATVDSDGQASFQFDPPESGQYALMLANASDGDGLVVSDGDLSIDGNVTILGVEQVAVQAGASSVNPTTLEQQSTVTPGTNLTFDASVDSTADTVGHTIVVYDERTGWVNQSFVVDVQEDLSSDFNVSEDVVLEHSVNETNGVARFEGEVTVGGTTFADERWSGPVNLPELLDSVAPAQLNPETEYVAAEGGERLDVSLTAVNGSPSETITVETLDNWTTNTRYRWVHVAVEADGTMYTDTDTFRLSSDGGDGSSPGDGDETDSGGGGGGAPGGDGLAPIPETTVDVTNDDGRAVVQIRNAKAFEPVDVDVSSVFADREGVRLDGMSIEFTRDRDFDMTVSQGSESVPPVHGTGSGLQYLPSVQGTPSDLEYINVSYAEEPETDGVQFTFTVEESLLEERGLDAGDVALYRYHDGEWVQLETITLGQTDSGYRYRAQSPGLSVFAVSTAEPQTAPQSALDVADVSLNPAEIDEGETTTVSATVENTADVEGTFTVNLTVDGDVVDQQTVTLGPGESETVSFTRQFDDNGRYQIGIGGADAGQLAVYEASQTTTTTDTTESPGAGDDGEDESDGELLLPLLLLLLLIAGVLYYLWQNDDIDFPPEGLGEDGSGPGGTDTSDVLDEESGLGSAGGSGPTATTGTTDMMDATSDTTEPQTATDVDDDDADAPMEESDDMDSDSTADQPAEGDDETVSDDSTQPESADVSTDPSEDPDASTDTGDGAESSGDETGDQSDSEDVEGPTASNIFGGDDESDTTNADGERDELDPSDIIDESDDENA